MKHTKKLAALFLALMMVFSLMAVTAAAYDAEAHEHTHACSAETIQPRIPAMRCPTCGTQMDAVHVYEEKGHTYIDFECPFGDGSFERFPW
ncbi:MAG: hypothetical protein HDT14_12240 [Oscillibacter sp.]|nr:hypothetical protein [Oscillibacter sp.]